eukprot:gene14974-biopygen12618
MMCCFTSGSPLSTEEAVENVLATMSPPSRLDRGASRSLHLTRVWRLHGASAHEGLEPPGASETAGASMEPPDLWSLRKFGASMEPPAVLEPPGASGIWEPPWSLRRFWSLHGASGILEPPCQDHAGPWSLRGSGASKGASGDFGASRSLRYFGASKEPPGISEPPGAPTGAAMDPPI